MSRHSFRICALADIPEGDSRGFSTQTPAGYQDIFLVRKQDQVFAYMNSCPHTGGPLDWVPDRFLNLDGELIQCATHAALFEIENGACVAGPCAGKALTAVTVEVRDEEVFLLE